MSNEGQQGSVRPYRHAIAGEPPPEGAAVKFHKILDHEVAAVRGALHELENKIAELRKRKE